MIEASDGVEALKILQTFKGRCELIIADVIMPRMTGAALVEAVQAFVPDIKVLFVSGYASDTVAANGVGDESSIPAKAFPAHDSHGEGCRTLVCAIRSLSRA